MSESFHGENRRTLEEKGRTKQRNKNIADREQEK